MNSIKHLISLFALILSMCVSAQNNQAERMNTYLNTNGTLTYYSGVVDRFFDFMKSEYAEQNVPDEVWSEMGSVKGEALAEISEMIYQAYQAHFSPEEIETMLDFYESDTGANVLKGAELSEDDIKARDTFYSSPVGQKISSSTESLNGVLKSITESWSSELFRNVQAQLEAKGYTKG